MPPFLPLQLAAPRSSLLTRSPLKKIPLFFLIDLLSTLEVRHDVQKLVVNLRMILKLSLDLIQKGQRIPDVQTTTK